MLKKLVISVCVSLALPLAAWASPNTATSSSEQLISQNNRIQQQRAAYQSAVDALRARDDATARKLRNGILKDYPLNVWVDYYSLSMYPSTAKYAGVQKFLKESGHGELNRLLTAKYVNHLAASGQFSRVLELMPQKPYEESDSMRKTEKVALCRFYEAKWHQGKAGNEAVAFATSLYNGMSSYPDDCAGLVALWKTKGYLTDSVKEGKFERSYITNRYEKVTRSLSGELQNTAFGARVNAAMALYGNPEKLFNLSNTKTNHQAAVLAFKRIANLNGSQAASRLEEFNLKFKPTEAELIGIGQVLAEKFLSMSGTKEEVEWLDKHLPAVAWNDKLKEKRLRRAIWFAQWPAVYALVSQLPESQRGNINWKYWKAHSAMEIGKTGEGRAMLAEVSEDRSFFGFLAAQKLGSKMPFNHQTLSHELKWPDAVRDNAAVQRFFELYAMNDRNADIEWKEIAKASSDEEALMMAEWALRNDKPVYSIQNIISGKRWDALNYRFPAPYRELYEKYSQRTNVSLSFLYGISRQESMMNPTIKSPVGAVGLMQLMPDTAKLVSKKNKWSYKGTSDLVVPDNNIRLGSAYLRNMLDKFDNNRLLAAAAYNAGPNRVVRWQSKDGLRRDAAMYVENIPFAETRLYVQNVILYDAIYNKLLTGQEGKLLTRNELNYNY